MDSARSDFSHTLINLLSVFKALYLCILTDMRSFDCLIGWQAHVGEVCSMQFSADETTAYSMGTDGKVNVLSYL